ncbi:MAG: DUF2190 family protein [Oscillospiraceae bacterium]|nr:DUF2190 family protein [Oscillospiraceae bacterium]
MYTSTGINDTPTIVGKATSAITGGAFLAAKFDANSGIVLAGAGENAIGLMLATTPDSVAAGEDVTVQIKDIGLWKTGAGVAAGAELTADAAGKAVTATAGKYVTAIALEKANAADEIIKVQIVKNGVKAAVTLDDLSDVTITTATNGQVLKYDGTKWANGTDAIA